MMLTKKEKYFIKQVDYLSKRIHIKVPFVVRDNRLGSNLACVCWTPEIKRYILRYNAKPLITLAYWEITHVVLHELGHIKKRGNNAIQSEYRAEKFAIKVIKELYPSYYKRALNFVKRYVKANRPIYGKAFAKILREEGV